MNSLQHQHDSQVAALAADYESQGYKVHIKPAIEQIPLDLNGYYPDILAEKEDQHLLVLANNTRKPVPISISRLQSLIENVKQLPGWRFLLVNYSPEYDATSFARVPLTWPDIVSRVSLAKHLRETGEAEAAILLFWSALEALLRRHAESVDLPLEHLSVTSLLNYLYSDADLSFEHFDQAKKLLAGRNQLAHGFPLAEASQQATQLQGLIDDLSSEWLPTREAA
jgi:hypothetical protein